MRNQTGVRVFSCILGSFALTQSAFPQGLADLQPGPWYFGFGMSMSQASIPQQSIDAADAALAGPLGSAFTIVDRDERTTGLKAFLGYEFSRHFSVEGGYAVLGNPKANLDFRSGLSSVGSFEMEYSMTSFFADAVGTLPLAEKWDLFGRLGVNVGTTRVNLTGSPLTIVTSNDNREETKVREKFGAGLQYKITQAFVLRGEWEHFKMPDPFSDELMNVDVATASLMYRF